MDPIKRPKKRSVKFYVWTELVEFVLNSNKFPKIKDPNIEDDLSDWFTSTFDETGHGALFTLSERDITTAYSANVTCVLICILGTFGKFDEKNCLKLKCIYE